MAITESVDSSSARHANRRREGRKGNFIKFTKLNFARLFRTRLLVPFPESWTFYDSSNFYIRQERNLGCWRVIVNTRIGSYFVNHGHRRFTRVSFVNNGAEQNSKLIVILTNDFGQKNFKRPRSNTPNDIVEYACM